MLPVAEQVADWKNDRAQPVSSLAEAQQYCRKLARSHHENFPLVSFLLPRGLHQHFFNVYAYCRWADDLGDEMGDSQRSLDLLAWWREELQACYAGQCRHPVFVALEPTVRQFDIPLQPFDDLISAFEQDQSVREYHSYAQLLDYCTRSANPVGRIVLHLCERFDEQNAEWSDAICSGLQLANFWQDVARDLDIGRIYLPAEDRDRFGVAREDLLAKRTTDQFVELMEFEVGRAHELLMAGLPLVARLPGRLQVDIELFARGGLRILDRVQSIGYRVLEQRPVVTKLDAFRLLVPCVGRAFLRKLV